MLEVGDIDIHVIVAKTLLAIITLGKKWTRHTNALDELIRLEEWQVFQRIERKVRSISLGIDIRVEEGALDARGVENVRDLWK